MIFRVKLEYLQYYTANKLIIMRKLKGKIINNFFSSELNNFY